MVFIGNAKNEMNKKKLHSIYIFNLNYERGLSYMNCVLSSVMIQKWKAMR